MKKLLLVLSISAITALFAFKAGAAAVDSYNALRSSVVGSRPTCAAALRGMIWQVQNTGSVADYTSICHLNAATAYAWSSFVSQ